jgi:tetratricopeptide (TPR) repeat protein
MTRFAILLFTCICLALTTGCNIVKRSKPTLSDHKSRCNASAWVVRQKNIDSCTTLIERPEATREDAKFYRPIRAQLLRRLNRPADSGAEYTALLAEYPDNPYFLVGRANAYLDIGVVEDALDDYGKAIALKPNFPPFYLGRGDVYLLYLNEPAKALADFQQAERAEQSPEMMALNREAAKRDASAFGTDEETLYKMFARGSGQAQMKQAAAYLRLGDFENGLDALRRGDKIFGYFAESRGLHCMYRVAAKSEGAGEFCHDVFKESVVISTDRHYPYVAFAFHYWAVGDVAEARRLIQEARALNASLRREDEIFADFQRIMDARPTG